MFAQTQVDEGLITCALNVTNRHAYSILKVLASEFAIQDLKANYHYPTLGSESEKAKELSRRKEMLKKWGVRIFSPDDVGLDSADGQARRRKRGERDELDETTYPSPAEDPYTYSTSSSRCSYHK
jgi:hypothetical protein